MPNYKTDVMDPHYIIEHTHRSDFGLKDETDYKELDELLEKNKANGNIDNIARLLVNNDIYHIDLVRYVIEKYGINENEEIYRIFMTKYKEFSNKRNLPYGDYCQIKDWIISQTDKVLSFRYGEVPDREKTIEFIVNEAADVKYVHTENSGRDFMQMVYNNAVPDEMKSDVDFIMMLLEKFPKAFPFVYEYINKKDIYTVLDKYYVEAYQNCRFKLTKEEADYVIEKVKEKGDIFLAYDRRKYDNPMQRNISFTGSKLLEKLRKKFGKSYEKMAEEQGFDPKDDVLFMKKILDSNALKFIYTGGFFNKNDILTLFSIINEFEKDGIDCSKTRRLINKYKREIAAEELDMYNKILANKNNAEELDKYLESLGVNRDNFFGYIKERKFLDAKLKEAVLLVLAKHYNTDYISVYDIVDVLQEMNERNLTLDEILNEKNISKKFFNSIYNRFKEENPVIYELIKFYLSNNKIHGFKKMLRLYYSVINSGINDYDSFVAKYGCSPEEILSKFENTDLYMDLYNLISSWYTLESKTPDVSADKPKKI